MYSVRDKLGTIIKEKRVRDNLTQEQLAERINVTTSFIGQVERGETMPSIETLELIVKELHIDPRYIFFDIPQGDLDYAELCTLIIQMSPKHRRFLLDFAKLLCSSALY